MKEVVILVIESKFREDMYLIQQPEHLCVVLKVC